MNKPLGVVAPALLATTLLLGIAATALLLWTPEARAAGDAGAALRAVDTSWVFRETTSSRETPRGPFCFSIR